MAKKKVMPFRRKREGRTNYKKRLALLKSNMRRIIIRKTNRQMIIQIAEYSVQGDKIICGVKSNSLIKLGWKYSCKNLPACYLAGLLLGKKAIAKKVKEAVLDIGLQTPVVGSKVYAALKGAIDAGMSIPASEEVFPPVDRLSGKSIVAFFSINKSETQFSAYKKNNLDPAKMSQDFDLVKKKIMSG
jgi:large subunit ribosomal protein L18